MFVDKLLEIIEAYHIHKDRLKPGQLIWPAVAIEAYPGYHKSLTETPQVPVILTLASQKDVEALRNNVKQTALLQQIIVRLAQEAYAQGGVLTTTDLSLLCRHGHSYIAGLIRAYEKETGQVVPRRGTVHDMGRSLTHKRIICTKAYCEGKPTHVIARETAHSPEAVDHYLLDFARVYFATVKRGMTTMEVAFTIQRPHYLVEEYVALIKALELTPEQVEKRSGLPENSEQTKNIEKDQSVETQ